MSNQNHNPDTLAMNDSQEGFIVPLTPQKRPQRYLHLSTVVPFQESPEKQANTEKPQHQSFVNKEEFETYMRENHPNCNGEAYDCESAFMMESGCNCCFSSDEQSQMNQYGVGVVIYFRFLKQVTSSSYKVIIYFSIFSILSIPQIYFSMMAGQAVYTQDVTLTQGLMMTTIGALSMKGDYCSKQSWSDLLLNDAVQLTNASTLQVVSIYCATGNISQFTIGLTDSESSCSYQEPSDAITTCNNMTTYNATNTLCYGNSSCKFIMKSEFFLTGCSANSSSLTPYVYAFCANSKVIFGPYELLSKNVAIICGYIDVILVVASFLLIWTLEQQDSLTTKNVHENEIFISSFTLEFSNIPEYSAEELYVTLTEQLETNLANKYNQQFHIVDVQCAKDNQFILLSEKRQEMCAERNKLVKRFEYHYSLHVPSMDLKMNMASTSLEGRMSEVPQNEQKQARDLLAQVLQLEQKISNIDIQLSQKKEPLKILRAWVTFETLEQRNLAFYLYKHDYLRNLFACCGCIDSKVLRVDGEIVRASPAAHPEDVNWDSLNYTTVQLGTRRLFSLILTILLMMATVAAIIFLKYEQVQFTSSYPEINCSQYTLVTQADVVIDMNKSVGRIGIVQCYCSVNVLDRIDTTFPDGSQYCRQWFNDQLKVVAFPFVIVVVIMIINEMIKIIFTKFSEFEGHRSKSKQQSSRFLKIFIVQFINTALVILIINIKFGSEISSGNISVFLNGKFSDTTTQWFMQVGTTILLTLIVYNIFPILELTLLGLIKYCKRCLDTRKLSPGIFTQKITQEELNEYYLGPEFSIELKYATVMNIIVVTYLYGSGLPILYVSTSLYFIITYICDKYIFLAICRTPLKSDSSVAEMSRQILKLALIAHTAMAIWVYGSNILFQETSQTLTYQILQGNVFSTFFQRAQTSQAIGLSAALCLLLIFYILWPFVINPILRTIFFFCYSDSTLFSTIQNSVISASQSIYGLYTQEQIAKIVGLLKIDISKEQSMKYQQIKKERIARLQQVQTQNIHFNGIPSYEILLNSKYEQFQHLV